MIVKHVVLRHEAVHISLDRTEATSIVLYLETRDATAITRPGSRISDINSTFSRDLLNSLVARLSQVKLLTIHATITQGQNEANNQLEIVPRQSHSDTE
ncbi:hypothetical protein ES702_00248 [subsurface metagenome]